MPQATSLKSRFKNAVLSPVSHILKHLMVSTGINEAELALI